VATIKKNDKNIFHTLKDAFSNQHDYCICPCSTIFSCWHKSKNIHNQCEFLSCDTEPFEKPNDILQHLYDEQHHCVYHALSLWIIQHKYSSLIANIKLEDNRKQKSKSFSEIHDGKVRLPTLVNSILKFETKHLMR